MYTCEVLVQSYLSGRELCQQERGVSWAQVTNFRYGNPATALSDLKERWIWHVQFPLNEFTAVYHARGSCF